MKSKERDELLKTLQTRFEANMHRHKGIAWKDVQARLEKNAEALESLAAMEETGGEPDVVAFDKKQGVTFYDCAVQSPAGRRSLCFDREALDSRKQNKPAGSAAEMAAEMGIDILTEDEYRALQKLEEFDTKTSSWINTPNDVRSLG